jgi:hypothetical protein
MTEILRDIDAQFAKLPDKDHRVLVGVLPERISFPMTMIPAVFDMCEDYSVKRFTILKSHRPHTILPDSLEAFRCA